MELDFLNNAEATGGMDNGGAGATRKTDKFQVRVFINMDEDDDGSLDVKPNDMFQRENQDLPFYVDVSEILG